MTDQVHKVRTSVKFVGESTQTGKVDWNFFLTTFPKMSGGIRAEGGGKNKRSQS